MNTVANALVEHEPVSLADVPALRDEGATIFNIIERAARDPHTDIDKMKQLMDMHERMQVRAAELEYDRAMSAAQQAMQPVRTDADNPQTRSKYASYFALDTAIRPIYTSNGFSLSFSTGEGAPEGHVRIVCRVAHSSGHRERPHIDMPNDGKGAKGGDVMTKTHATGSAITYGKRYLLGMIFNIAVGGKDDDGNAAGNQALITEEQVVALRDLLDSKGADTKKFLKFIKLERLEDIYATAYDKVVDVVKTYKGA